MSRGRSCAVRRYAVVGDVGIDGREGGAVRRLGLGKADVSNILSGTSEVRCRMSYVAWTRFCDGVR